MGKEIIAEAALNKLKTGLKYLNDSLSYAQMIFDDEEGKNPFDQYKLGGFTFVRPDTKEIWNFKDRETYKAFLKTEDGNPNCNRPHIILTKTALLVCIMGEDDDDDDDDDSKPYGVDFPEEKRKRIVRASNDWQQGRPISKYDAIKYYPQNYKCPECGEIATRDRPFDTRNGETTADLWCENLHHWYWR